MTTYPNPSLLIREFEPDDQTAARQLILDGLAGHWGELDLTLNPDLNDIALSFANGVFLVAFWEDKLAGTGALVPEGNGRGRIARMSVDQSLRRMGIGRSLLDMLIQYGRELGYNEIVLETTETWEDAVGFYQRYGFETVGFAGGDRHFRLVLSL
jgi:ribosomal protein S18 acetylase RimI-like enzyme